MNNKQNIDWDAYTIELILDWAGQRPSMSFYDKLHSEGIRYRAGTWAEEVKMREEFPSPLARRHALSQGKAKAIPGAEGVYYCRSEDIARLIIKWAQEDTRAQPASIRMGHVRLVDARLSEQDIKTLENYQQRKHLAARSKEDKGRYTITCFQEGITYSIDAETLQLSCIYCGDVTHVNIRQGGLRTLTAEPVGDLWTYWLRTRFDNAGMFEIPKLVQPGKSRTVAERIPVDPYIAMEMFDLQIPPEAEQYITGHNKWLEIWDALFCLKNGGDRRRHGRLDVTTAYARAGGMKDYLMRVPPDNFDIVDLCILHNKEFYKFL